MLKKKQKRVLKLFLITVLLSGWGAQIVNAQNKIIFYAPFDGDIKPQAEMKPDNFKTQGKIRFTEGLEGEAIVVGNGWAEYFFPAAGIFNYPQGSVSVWVKPINWDDESFLDLMITFAGKYKKQMRIYRYGPHNNIGINAYFCGGLGLHFPRTQLNKWKKKYGNWHNIIWTWNENKATLYIDGIPVNEKTDTKGFNKEKIQKSQHLMIGNISVSYPGGKRVVTKKETAIDEVKIYNYTLGPEEIKKGFEKYNDKRVSAFSYNNVKISDFSSKKLLHDFYEEVKLQARLVNQNNAPLDLDLEVWIKKGVDREFKIHSEKLILPGGGEKDLSFSWDPQKNEYGFAAYIVLKKTDKIVLKSEPVIFEVCHDWQKISRRTGQTIYHKLLDPSQAAKIIDNRIKHARDFYLNDMEFFGEMWPTLTDHTPEEDEWNYIWETRPGWSRKSRIAKKKIKEWIKKAHDAGIKVGGYTHTPGYYLFDESWKVYDPSTGRLMRDHAGSSKEGMVWLDEHSLGVPHALKYADHLSKNIAASIKEYDWDSWFLDSFPQCIKSTKRGVDKNGNPLTDLTADELFEKAIKMLTERTAKVKDDFVIIPNTLHHVVSGLEHHPSRDMWGEDLGKFPYPRGNKYIPVWFGEFRYCAPPNAALVWQLGRTWSSVREVTGKPVWALVNVNAYYDIKDLRNTGKAWRMKTKPEEIKPVLALILANGVGYWDYFQTHLKDPDTHAPSKITANYLKFACRYSQYLCDLNIKWTPKGMVTVKSPDHVYWKGNSFMRKFKKHMEVYIHLINYETSYINARLLKLDKYGIPPKVDNIEAVINLPQGYTKAKEVYFITPDNDQEPEKIKVTLKDGKATVIIPSLEYWSTAIVKFEK